MGEELDICNTSLGLGIGDRFVGPRESDDQKKSKNKNKRVVCLDLSFPLYLKEEEEEEVEEADIDHDQVRDEYTNSKEDGSISSKTVEEEEEKTRERSDCDNNNNNSNNNNSNGSRKKLRLTKEQSTLLEDSFKVHTTLNTGQKQALAEKLNLLPRQVEVWFQNRRARTKLKQTEVDCEFLKKCCESLSDENQRLKKELHELRSLKIEQTSSASTLSCIQLPTTSMLCPSCEKSVKAAGGGVDAKHGLAVTDMVLHDNKIYKINNPERR